MNGRCMDATRVRPLKLCVGFRWNLSTCVTVDLDFSGGHPAGAHLVLGAVRVCSMSAAWWLADASPPAPLGMPCPGGAQFRFAQT